MKSIIQMVCHKRTPLKSTLESIISDTYFWSYEPRKHNPIFRQICEFNTSKFVSLTHQSQTISRRLNSGSEPTYNEIVEGPLTPSVSVKAAMTLAILFSLKTMESIQNGVVTHFRATPLFSMRTVLLASLQSCR